MVLSDEMGMKRSGAMDKQGYLYTVAVIVMVIPLILLILFYTGMEKSKIEDTSGRIRCDELYYFVQDVGHDMERAVNLFGRRAAVYATDHVVTNGTPLWNYTYHNCSDFVFDGNASEAAVAELVLCGTLYGKNVTYMVNHTLPQWINRITQVAEGYHYVFNLTLLDFDVLPYDAWNFALVMNTTMSIHDETGLCYYVGENVTLTSITSIIGLEDPLYPLNTNNHMTKYYKNCTPEVSLSDRAGCSESGGGGSAPGYVVFYSDLKGNKTDLETYCMTNPNIGATVIVFDTAFGSCNQLLDKKKVNHCFNISDAHHFAAAIQYIFGEHNNPSIGKCNITIPWITGTGDIDNDTHGGSHPRDPNCADANISAGACVYVRNIDECGVHEVLMSRSSADIDTSCYSVSNITGLRVGCGPPENGFLNGPSFFDRLDGRLNLSQRYAEQASANFGSNYIGLETLVSPYDLEAHRVEPRVGSTWVDYLYWGNHTGCQVANFCPGDEYPFHLDCPHAMFYGVDTSCPNGSETLGSGNAPNSTIKRPINDSTFFRCPRVNITGEADDCDGEVVQVEVGINGVWRRADWDNSSTWNYTLSTSITGIYTIQSRAMDDDGLRETPSDGIVIVISNCSGGDNTPPVPPTLIFPPNLQTGVSTTPTFVWTAAVDPSGIYRYQIQVDNSPPDWASLATDERVGGTTYNQTSTLNNNKWYAWRVRAQDNAGNWGWWTVPFIFKTKT